MKHGLSWTGLLLVGLLVNANAAFAGPLSTTVSCASEIHLWGSTDVQATWTAHPSGGVPPYTYKWYPGSSTFGTNQVFTATLYANNQEGFFGYCEVPVVVKDSIGQTATASCTTAVWEHYDPNECMYYDSFGHLVYC